MPQWQSTNCAPVAASDITIGPLDWEEAQKRSDELLAEAVRLLCTQQAITFDGVTTSRPGNYLISLNVQSLYIGEAANLMTRIRQQYNTKTSTFYKTYIENYAPRPIRDFTLRHIETAIGRKEVEEFGIPNIPCRLNKFRTDKRSIRARGIESVLWLRTQCSYIHLLEQGERAVMTAESKPWSSLSPQQSPGIYIVRRHSDSALLYIGESCDLAERYDTHSHRTYFSALRRHIATQCLHFVLKERNGKAKYLDDSEDAEVSRYLSGCTCAFTPVTFGRYELEEHLIRKYHPVLNRKANSGR